MNLLIIPSDICNLKCSHCFNEKPSNDSMSSSTVYNLIDFIKSIKASKHYSSGIDLTFTGGGEPFLNLEAMSLLLSNFDLYNFSSICFKTNGAFLKSQKAKDWLHCLFATALEESYMNLRLNISNSSYHKNSRCSEDNKLIDQFVTDKTLVKGNDVLQDYIDFVQHPYYDTNPIKETWSDGVKPYTWGRAKGLPESTDFVNCCPLLNIFPKEYEYIHSTLTVMPNGDICFYCSINKIILGNVNDKPSYDTICEKYLKLIADLREATGLESHNSSVSIKNTCSKCLKCNNSLN